MTVISGRYIVSVFYFKTCSASRAIFVLKREWSGVFPSVVMAFMNRKLINQTKIDCAVAAVESTNTFGGF